MVYINTYFLNKCAVTLSKHPNTKAHHLFGSCPCSHVNPLPTNTSKFIIFNCPSLPPSPPPVCPDQIANTTASHLRLSSLPTYYLFIFPGLRVRVFLLLNLTHPVPTVSVLGTVNLWGGSLLQCRRTTFFFSDFLRPHARPFFIRKIKVVGFFSTGVNKK